MKPEPKHSSSSDKKPVSSSSNKTASTTLDPAAKAKAREEFEAKKKAAEAEMEAAIMKIKKEIPEEDALNIFPGKRTLLFYGVERPLQKTSIRPSFTSVG